ncbi:type IV pilus twitching motility protein PilT [Schnuerera sp. xch1]|uniref:type IV pilus twitching motility protein PilT n=1 Tax=Schnuerera sp. xch1 TaxID=2874283 RepID=UPI001CBABF27|nr:type IV pilus twitching motility protein PilT [Schnuerera sp. xch1]MBZ2173727.1 type IV pilus twitching motility protein PilT [Schnuerera sp. xch1]
MNLINLLKYAISNNASDIHITVGIPPVLRINGSLINCKDSILNCDDTEKLVKQILDKDQLDKLDKNGQIDTLYSNSGIGRFRVNAYKQKRSYGMAIRIIPLRVPTIDELGLPNIIKDSSRLPRGLVLVTGPTGSGKSTTLASMINLINEERRCHILTLEDPIEYLHKHNKSVINQREIGIDTNDFNNALRAALRQDPDVIFVGEMRDLDTISTVLTAAETGHLVLSTLHTIDAAKTIDRIIDVFPSYQQQQVRVQFSSVIQSIISQQLLPKANGNGRVAAVETMTVTPAIRNLIREDKIHQIETAIQTGSKAGMKTMDGHLLELYNKGIISKDTILNQAINLDYVKRYIH